MTEQDYGCNIVSDQEFESEHKDKDRDATAAIVLISALTLSMCVLIVSGAAIIISGDPGGWWPITIGTAVMLYTLLFT